MFQLSFFSKNLSFLSFSRKWKSILIFFLLIVSLFGLGEKSLGEEEKCGTDNKGTCQKAEGILLNKCPSAWSTYDEGTNYCQPDGMTKYICCIANDDICAGKSEGSLCEINNTEGNCVNGKCETGDAPAGGACGSNNGICMITGDANALGCSQNFGGRDCGLGYYCAINCNSDSAVSCGTNGGTCKTACDDTKGEKEDSTTPQCTNSQKCCYVKYIPGDGTTPKDFGYKNPLRANTFTEWAEKVLTSIQSIVGWLAVIMLMIGGIVYLTSAGTNQVALGKSIITAALIGFAVVVAGPSLLKEIKDIASTSSSSSSSAIDNAKDIKSIITSVLEFLLASMGTLALIGFAVGGIFYLTAFGDKGKAETGKKMAINSLYAIALAGGGLILVNQILSLLEG